LLYIITLYIVKVYHNQEKTIATYKGLMPQFSFKTPDTIGLDHMHPRSCDL